MAKHPIVHFEIYGTDRDSLATFYADTFGWELQPVPNMDYTLVNIGEEGVRGGGISGADADFTGTVIYVSCPDIAEGVDKAVANGAEVVHPVTTIPGMVTFAILKDPQGNRFGLVDEKMPEAV
jgi:predicted enzyme related to lactoylglutathione lyase